MFKKTFNKKYFYILGAIFLAWLFYYICSRTPLAGDDWGYYLTGIKGNVLESTIQQYNSWSGRIFSELWGYLITPRKELWNILNPLFFVLVYIGVYKLVKVENKYFVIPLVVIVMMLTIDNNLRMETYTWIMGSTYVIPLCLSIWYLVIVDLLFRRSLISKRHIFLIVLSNIFLFIIGLMMENITAALILGIIILIIYSYSNNRKIMKYLIINLIVISISFIICRMSPGSAYRLARDNADWVSLNVFEKIYTGYPTFLQMTFINNKYMIFFLGIVLIGLMFVKRKRIKPYILIPSFIIQALSIFTVFSGTVIKDNNMFTNPNSIYSMVFWIIYTIDLFVVIYNSFDSGLYRDKVMFILFIAGASAVAMLFSPVYGSRSAIFTVYFIIVLTCLIIDRYNINKWILLVALIVLIVFTYKKTKFFMGVYDQVAYDQEKRLVDIEYYRSHPEEKEAWIKRFEDGSIHGIDVNPEDTYHLERFKEYYNLPQEAKDIIFYYNK